MGGERSMEKGGIIFIKLWFEILRITGHVKRVPGERIPKLITEWIPLERRKRGRPRKTWKEGVQAGMTTRNLEPDQWRNRGMAFGFRKTATGVIKPDR
jgi:hypothetical protein